MKVLPAHSQCRELYGATRIYVSEYKTWVNDRVAERCRKALDRVKRQLDILDELITNDAVTYSRRGERMCEVIRANLRKIYRVVTGNSETGL